MWRGLIVRSGSLRPGHERQSKMDIPPANNPNSKFAAVFIPEVLKTRNVTEARSGGKAFHAFFFQRTHERLVGADHPSEKGRGLLPFAFLRNVTSRLF
jgi:hypothetical protein